MRRNFWFLEQQSAYANFDGRFIPIFDPVTGQPTSIKSPGRSFIVKVPENTSIPDFVIWEDPQFTKGFVKLNLWHRGKSKNGSATNLDANRNKVANEEAVNTPGQTVSETVSPSAGGNGGFCAAESNLKPLFWRHLLLRNRATTNDNTVELPKVRRNLTSSSGHFLIIQIGTTSASSATIGTRWNVILTLWTPHQGCKSFRPKVPAELNHIKDNANNPYGPLTCKCGCKQPPW